MYRDFSNQIRIFQEAVVRLVQLTKSEGLKRRDLVGRLGSPLWVEDQSFHKLGLR